MLLTAGCGNGEDRPAGGQAAEKDTAVQVGKLAPLAETMNDLRVLLVDLAAKNVCSFHARRFLALSSGGASGHQPGSPVNGQLWIDSCSTSEIDPQHLHVELYGKGWRWLARERGSAGATFEIDEYFRFAMRLSMDGTVDVAYDAQDHILTFWYVPTRPVDASFWVTGDLDVRTETLWSSIVGGAASIIGQSPEARTREEIRRRGQRRTRARVSRGLTFVLDLCNGQQFMRMGNLAAGTVPELAFEPGGKIFLANTRTTLHRDGLLMAGGYNTRGERLVARLQVDEGPGVKAAFVCLDAAREVFDAYYAGSDLPAIEPLESVTIRSGEQKELAVGPGTSCMVVLLMQPAAQEDTPVHYRYAVFRPKEAQRELVPCGAGG
jgi:hypothetical protein